jgi:hypothetical protein
LCCGKKKAEKIITLPDFTKIDEKTKLNERRVNR